MVVAWLWKVISGSAADSTSKPVVPVPPRVIFAISILPNGTKRLVKVQVSTSRALTVASTAPSSTGTSSPPHSTRTQRPAALVGARQFLDDPVAAGIQFERRGLGVDRHAFALRWWRGPAARRRAAHRLHREVERTDPALGDLADHEPLRRRRVFVGVGAGDEVFGAEVDRRFGVGDRGGEVAGAVARGAGEIGEAPVDRVILGHPPGLAAGRGGAAVEGFLGGPAGGGREARSVRPAHRRGCRRS